MTLASHGCIFRIIQVRHIRTQFSHISFRRQNVMMTLDLTLLFPEILAQFRKNWPKIAHTVNVTLDGRRNCELIAFLTRQLTLSELVFLMGCKSPKKLCFLPNREVKYYRFRKNLLIKYFLNLLK